MIISFPQKQPKTGVEREFEEVAAQLASGDVLEVAVIVARRDGTISEKRFFPEKQCTLPRVPH